MNEIYGLWILTFFSLDLTVAITIASESNITWTSSNMIYNLTEGILSTSARAGIFAFTIDASEMGGTIRTKNTLWTTALIGITNIILFASTSASSILFPTKGMNTAWIWRAGCVSLNGIVLLLFNALNKGVSSCSLWTDTDCCVTDNFALCWGCASSYTWILTLLIHTSEIAGTLWVRCTLRTAVWRRSDHFRDTRANCLFIYFPTYWIWATWGGIARIEWSRRRNIFLWFSLAAWEGIASEAIFTFTVRPMVYNITQGVSSTRSLAWIHALLITARFILRTVWVWDTFGPAGRRRADILR